MPGVSAFSNMNEKRYVWVDQKPNAKTTPTLSVVAYELFAHFNSRLLG